MVFGFWSLACYAATQLAIHLHQERIQVVHSHREARKCPAESNGTPAFFFGLFPHTASPPITAGTHTGGVQK